MNPSVAQANPPARANFPADVASQSFAELLVYPIGHKSVYILSVIIAYIADRIYYAYTDGI